MSFLTWRSRLFSLSRLSPSKFKSALIEVFLAVVWSLEKYNWLCLALGRISSELPWGPWRKETLLELEFNFFPRVLSWVLRPERLRLDRFLAIRSFEQTDWLVCWTVAKPAYIYDGSNMRVLCPIWYFSADPKLSSLFICYMLIYWCYSSCSASRKYLLIWSICDIYTPMLSGWFSWISTSISCSLPSYYESLSENLVSACDSSPSRDYLLSLMVIMDWLYWP